MDGRARDSSELVQTAWRMTQAAALLVLGQMRAIEEDVLDPDVRWQTLRSALEQFSQKEPPS